MPSSGIFGGAGALGAGADAAGAAGFGSEPPHPLITEIAATARMANVVRENACCMKSMPCQAVESKIGCSDFTRVFVRSSRRERNRPIQEGEQNAVFYKPLQ